jgi:hypothetical protein
MEWLYGISPEIRDRLSDLSKKKTDDILDSIVGCFGFELGPTGPFFILPVEKLNTKNV